tara:strand:- start:2248 stop:2526 length:279 start_codon:yes stop_codon:yes gene_type:complete
VSTRPTNPSTGRRSKNLSQKTLQPGFDFLSASPSFADPAPLSLSSAPGLILATGGDVGAAEDVYPFSVDGGRRLNEKRIELQPYVTNGQLFR